MRWLTVYAAALLVALVSGLPLLTLGLVLHESISRPLWLVVSTLLAAIAASWISNVAAARPGHARLLPVVALSEALALGLLVPIALLAPRLLMGLQFRQVSLLLFFSPLLAGMVTMAAARLRAPKPETGKSVLITLGLLAAAVVVVIGTLLVADLLGLAGA